MLSNFSLTSCTRLYCLLGSPVSHSLSPIIHNAMFSHFGFDSVYLSFDVVDIAAGISGVRALGIKGCSITSPYKVSVMEYLDYIDDNAAKIGSVNTILNDNGILVGYNFDCDGAILALLEKTEIKNKTVVILGAGGSSRAIGYGVKKHGGKIKIVNRSIARGEILAEKLEAEFSCSLDSFIDKADIIINATPVGSFPEDSLATVSIESLNSNMIVMDLVYSPVETILLKMAKKIGCQTVNGLKMLGYQGILQFEIWTGFKPPFDYVKSILKCYVNG